jgi:hypothetical protein
MTAPTIEERLCAAAFSILTDGLPHRNDARLWAIRFLRRASHGHATEFQRSIRAPRS